MVVSYLRNTLIFFWLVGVFLVGTVYAIFNWGRPNIMCQVMRWFSWGTLKLGGIQVEIQGEEHREAHQPCVYISNHQHGLDLAVFGHHYPSRTVTIGKRELLLIPGFGLFFAAAGNILINRQNRKDAHSGLALAARRVREKGVSIGLFPEGTRNRSGHGMLPFKKGAFHLALQAGVPIVPIVCSPYDTILDRQKGILKGGRVILRYLPPFHVVSDARDEIDRLANETRERMLTVHEELGKLVQS